MKKVGINNKLLIAIIVIIAVIVIGALAAMVVMQPKAPQKTPITQAADKATKLAFYNNGTTWLHLDVVMENVTLKNGTIQNFYAQIFLKPKNGTVTIDLSNLTGYGNQKLPAGTKITILAWKGLFMPANSTPAVGNTSDLILNMQGWSNTLQPGADDAKFNVFFPQLNITQLPTISGKAITDDTIIINTNANEVKFIPEISEGQEPIFEQELLTVDSNGKVTITPLQAPTLCKLVAHII